MNDVLDRLTTALADRYTIERELGQGGMATVYLARDIKHDRDVAIKVLRPELAVVIGAERFLREIKTIATLQHPHILGLIDSGEVNGTAYYVMPFVEGESLRDRLQRDKQLPISDAVRLATEVAAALDYAHRHGVIHRDIKPENILLHDGSALVADFGIALAVSSAGGGTRMTETGMSLGTPHYMSPEQAMGERELTARSDVYALGAMTYEMLIGDPPFTGSTAQAIVAKVMTSEPAGLIAQRKSIPVAVEDAVLTALEKLPADRFASAAEFGTALSGGATVTRRSVGVRRSLQGTGSARWRDPVVLMLGGIAAVALVLLAWQRTHAADPASDVVSFVIPVSGTGGNVLGYNAVAISRDGQWMAYTGQGDGGGRLLAVRRIDDVTERLLPGTENASSPVFSPDGTSIAFFRGNQLFRIALNGGRPEALGTAPGIFNGMDWSTSGRLFIGSVASLYLLPEAGGAPVVFLPADQAGGEQSKGAPVVLDEAGVILYASWRGPSATSARIAIASLETGETTVLDLPGTAPVGMIDDVLIYGTAAGTLMGVTLDLPNRRVTGIPVQLLADVGYNQTTGLARVALSATGTLFYERGSPESRVVLADASGVSRVLLAEAREYAFPRLSPDGSTLAITVGGGGRRDVWLYDLRSGSPTRLTTGGTTNERPEWSPDGTRVLYRTDQGTRATIWWRPANLSANATQLVAGDRLDIFEAVISPDGQRIAYQLDTLGADVYYRGLTGDTIPKPIANNGNALENMPRISPDGKWIAFVTDESGDESVVVQPFPGPGGRVQVSTGAGAQPVWSRDGRRLIYRSGGWFIAATVRTTPDFAVVSRDTLLADNYVNASNPHANFDVTLDGSQLVVLKALSQGERVVVTNWRSVLKARMREATK